MTMRGISQLAALIGVNLRTLGQRRGSALSTVVGVACVVAVFVVVLSIGEGFRATMAATGSPDSALVLRGGSDSEMMSGLLVDATRIIADAPGVARAVAGPQASAELFVVVDLPKRSTGTDANVPLRGVQPAAFAVRKSFKIISGRNFEPGKNEIIVGRGAAEQFAGLELGRTLRWGENQWTVVGVFSDGGSLSESEIWTDARVLQPAYRRGNTFQSVHARLESPAAFTAFKDALTQDPRLDVKVVRESEYYAGQSQALTTLVRILGGFITVLMALGAIFGALNTMYNAVASRTREIATLRALGFGRGPVVLSILAESLVIALLGAVIGGAVAYFGFNGFQTSTLNWQSFSQVAFAFRVTPALLVTGTVIALAIGLVGGLLPAVRAARLPVATALREL
ncbi:MAG TPA: ABC transporter permease [Thermoanaerobaculia bacterium]|nr:ABC transporter permease [Thermoanaerobaculia bacterium]